MRIDAVDYRIIRILQKDARTPLRELSRQTGVSIPTARSRLLKLLDSGVIKKLTAVVDLHKLIGGLTAFMTLETKLSNSKEVADALKSLPEITEIYLTTGEHDVVVKVFVPDSSSLEELILMKLNRIPGVEKCKSSFIMENVKDQFDTDLKPVLMDKMLCTQCGIQIISKVTIHQEGKQDLFFCSDSCASTHTNNIPGSQNGMKISLSEEVSRHSNNLFEVRSTETATPSGGSRIE